MTRAVANVFRKAGFQSIDLGAGRYYSRMVDETREVGIARDCPCTDRVPGDPDEPCRVFLFNLPAATYERMECAADPFKAIALAEELARTTAESAS